MATAQTPTLRAFNQGAAPRIAVFNKAATPLGVDLDKLIAALQVYIDKYIVPVWNTPATLFKSTGFQKGCWAMVFLDDADEPDALAYHDLTPDGLPEAKVFVRTTINDGELVSVSASHELVEMLVDPGTNLMTTGPDAKSMYAYESADPVEDLTFKVNGIALSDFVHPAYFEIFHKAGSVKFDHLGKVTKPFQVLKGGYQVVFKSGKWTQVFASEAKKKRFKKEDRRGHRSEQRKEETLVRADPRLIAKGEAIKAGRSMALAPKAAPAKTAKKSALIAQFATRKTKRAPGRT